MGAAASSSSSPAFSPKKYDVFISFRGEDTRTNFISHLHSALSQKSIRTFIDKELPRGDDISQSLIQTIHDSGIFIVVFSQNYASSKWCLDELTHILQCKEDEGQFVIPVFDKVDPSDVRNQNGTYREAFAKHEQDFILNYEKIHKQDLILNYENIYKWRNTKIYKWRNALYEAANLAGWDFQTMRDESMLIQYIVNDVLRKLKQRYPSALKGLVGIDDNCEYIELLLEYDSIVGIWGMGGIGKTTMAKAVFAKLCSKFESYCFLENVREESEKHGSNHIRDKLISELLKDENLHYSTSDVLASTFIMGRLSSKKVFIVLDDVSSSKQLDDLARECDCLSSESRVIITTRDKHVLMGRAGSIHEAKALRDHESLKLFCYKAFQNDHPEVGYEQLSERAIKYANGIPLALTVLGSFLYSKTTEEWDSALRKLEKTPNEDIQEVLKLSYNGLNFEEREMFLDIACFLKGEDKELVIRLFESYGFHSSIGIRTLLDKALITIDHGVSMHDLIQAMGWEIVRQECLKHPGRRSRLWDLDEVYDVLRNNRGTDAIEGIQFDGSQIREIILNVDTFKKMPNLRFLRIHCNGYLNSYNWIHRYFFERKSCNVNLPSTFESFSDKLRYFYWDQYPLDSLPASKFYPQNLVEIHLKKSRVKELWDGVQDFVNLRKINLSGSKQLLKLPDFSRARNLEWVNLSKCKRLCTVHPSILSLPRLTTLDLCLCIRLKSLISGSVSKSLSELNVSFCLALEEFSLWSEEITDLDIRASGIKTLHSSIGHLKKLERLHFNCSKLKSLPMNGLCSLTSLKDLSLFKCQLIDKSKLHILFDALCSLKILRLKGCSDLSEFPDNISALSSLTILSLDGSNVENLPASMKHLSKLHSISLKECKKLQSIPELPPFVSELDATNCTSLETAFTFSCNYRMKSCFLVNCVKLDELSHSAITVDCYLSLLREVYLSKRFCYSLSARADVCYPGSKVPEWFGDNRTTKASMIVELAPLIHNFLGFIFCAVLAQISDVYCGRELKLRVYLEDGEGTRDLNEWRLDRYIDFNLWNSDHVLLWCYPNSCRYITC